MARGKAVTPRSREDVERTVRSIARHFACDAVVIIGSQALLLVDRDLPDELRMTNEVDAYPDNADE